jgi:hypothetical protein
MSNKTLRGRKKKKRDISCTVFVLNTKIKADTLYIHLKYRNLEIFNVLKLGSLL